MNPAVRVRKLGNGLTSYVARNPWPADRAYLRLIVRAGSAHEAPGQLGAAHFVEHMAFQGTEHQSKQERERLLESLGMIGGVHFNAATSFDSTEYQLTVPSHIDGALERALGFLREVAHDLSFEPGAVEEERRVILEEWRAKQDPERRWFRDEVATLLHDARQSSQPLVAAPGTIKTIARESLLQFYRAWYQPENMALIAVGDVEPAQVERQIEAMFGNLHQGQYPRVAASPAARQAQPLSVRIVRHPEATSIQVMVHDVLAPQVEQTKRDYRNRLVERLLLRMLEWRWYEGREGSRRLAVSAHAKDFGREIHTRSFASVIPDGGAEGVLRTLVGELASVARYGFNGGELARAKSILLAEWSDVHATGEPARDAADALKKHFLSGRTVLAPELERAWTRELFSSITLDDVNAMARSQPGAWRRSVSVLAPVEASLPSVEDLRAVVRSAEQSPPTLPLFELVHGTLIDKSPKRGRIVERRVDQKYGVTYWTLSNGMRVAVRPTGYPAVYIRGVVPGAAGAPSRDDWLPLSIADRVMDQLGVGRFDEHRLARLLGGKPIDVAVTLSDRGGAFDVETTSDNFPTALQLLYLRLTDPGSESLAFEGWKKYELDRLVRRLNSPGDVFQDATIWARTGNDPQRAPLRPDLLASLDLGKVRSTWLERFSSFSGATVVIYGGRFLGTQSLERTVETYLGGLPGGTSEQRPMAKAALPRGKLERTIRWGAEPLGRFFLEFDAPEKSWTLDLERDQEIFERFLEERLGQELRERQGKVYSVTVAASLAREPEVSRTLRVSFVCAPENLDALRQAVFRELANLGRSNIEPARLEILAAQMRRRRLEQKQSVHWAVTRIERTLRFGDDPAQLDDTNALVARVTAENLRATARRLFDSKRYVLVVQRPEAVPGTAGTVYDAERTP